MTYNAKTPLAEKQKLWWMQNLHPIIHLPVYNELYLILPLSKQIFITLSQYKNKIKREKNNRFTSLNGLDSCILELYFSVYKTQLWTINLI